MTETKQSDRKPRKCPECGHAPVASIVYGSPAHDDAMQAKLDAGRLVLGGCVVEQGAPRWCCTACGWTDPPRDVEAVDAEAELRG